VTTPFLSISGLKLRRKFPVDSNNRTKRAEMESSDQSSAKSRTSSQTSISSGTVAPVLPPPQRSNSQSSLNRVGHIAAHRQSFAEHQRHPPPSPRSQRHLSFTQQAIQELLTHPPSNRQPNPRFAGRDWQDIPLGELASQDDVKWADLGTSVEEATMVSFPRRPGPYIPRFARLPTPTFVTGSSQEQL
jgi:hypothetical protein